MSTRRFLACGATVATEWPFASPLIDTTEPVDVMFTVGNHAPGAGIEEFAHEVRSADGTTTLALGYSGANEVLRFPLTGDAWLLGSSHVHFHIRQPERSWAVERLLLRSVLATWLERRGRIALHASAAAVNGRAFGFLGSRRAGKTNLALAALDIGGKILTDDLLAVSIASGDALVRPSYPHVRLWPADALRFRGSVEGFRTVAPNSEKLEIPLREAEFSVESTRLRALYIPVRSNASDVTFALLSPTAALFSLLHMAYSGWFVDVPDHRAGWVSRVAGLVHRVPVFRMEYPDSSAGLSPTLTAVGAHVAGL